MLSTPHVFGRPSSASASPKKLCAATTSRGVAPGSTSMVAAESMAERAHCACRCPSARMNASRASLISSRACARASDAVGSLIVIFVGMEHSSVGPVALKDCSQGLCNDHNVSDHRPVVVIGEMCPASDDAGHHPVSRPELTAKKSACGDPAVVLGVSTSSTAANA